MYAKKMDIAREFGMSYQTVFRRVEGIRKQIGKRYNEYAIVGRLVSKEVFVDYEKYHESLEDRNLRKYVPPFDIYRARQYLDDMRMSEKNVEVKEAECRQINATLVVCVDNDKMQKLLEFINTEFN